MTPSNITRLVPRRERISRQVAADLLGNVDALASAGDLPPVAADAIRSEVFRHVRPDPASSAGWRFVMISNAQAEYVLDQIDRLPSASRPHLALRIFTRVFLHLRQDTGEVLLSRDEIAEKLGARPEHVSRAMTALVRIGAVLVGFRPTPGVRGHGRRVYFVNPHVAWNGDPSIRRELALQAAQPSLRLVGGSDVPVPEVVADE